MLYLASMEISRNLINPYQLPAPNRGDAQRAPADRRYSAEQATAGNRTAETARPAKDVSRAEIVNDKGSADYSEMLQQARAGLAREDFRRVTPAATEPLGVQRALDAYQGNADSLDSGGVELLPRIDSYV
jgi:hypothetical protein